MSDRDRKTLNDRLVNATGKQVDDDLYLGRTVYGRPGTAPAEEHGVVYKVSRCTLVGCSNTRLHVKWDNGVYTYPCLSDLKVRDDNSLEIK